MTVSNGVSEFEKAVNGFRRPLTHIMDWFHIAMKFHVIKQLARKFLDLLAPNGRTVQDETASAKWLIWHGNGYFDSRAICATFFRLWRKIFTCAIYPCYSGVNIAFMPPLSCNYAKRSHFGRVRFD
jgi:hypothetical protein